MKLSLFIAANKVEVNASEFNSKLNELETLLNQPASEGFKELSKKSKVINDGNKKLGTIEDDVSRILTEMEKLTKVSTLSISIILL